MESAETGRIFLDLMHQENRHLLNLLILLVIILLTDRKVERAQASISLEVILKSSGEFLYFSSCFTWMEKFMSTVFP